MQYSPKFFFLCSFRYGQAGDENPMAGEDDIHVYFLTFNLRIFLLMWSVFLITDISSSKPVTQSMAPAGPYNKKLQLTISSTDRDSIFECVSEIENTFTTVNEL